MKIYSHEGKGIVYMYGILSATSNVVGQVANDAAATAKPTQLTADVNLSLVVIFILISLVISVVIPSFFMLWGMMKHRGSVSQTFLGILGFVLFKTIIPLVVFSIIFPSYVDQSVTTFESTIQVVIVVIFTEIGRFLLLLSSRKKKKEFGQALTFGAGYCIMEALIIAVAFLIPYLLVAIDPEGSGIGGLYQELRIFVIKDNLIAGEEYKFLLKGYICIVFCLSQISSSIMMFTAVQKKRFGIAVLPLLFGLLIMIPNKMSSNGTWFWGNMPVILPYLGIITVISSLVAYSLWKNEYQTASDKQD